MTLLRNIHARILLFKGAWEHPKAPEPQFCPGRCGYVTLEVLGLRWGFFLGKLRLPVSFTLSAWRYGAMALWTHPWR